MKKKIIAIIAILLVISSGSAYYVLIYVPHQKAVISFNQAVQSVQASNKTLQTAIADAEKQVASKQQPLDSQSLDNLKAALETAKPDLRKIPKLADSTEAINKQAKALKQPLDYSETIQRLTDNTTAYTTSVKQLTQITNPSQDFVEKRLKEIDTIQEIQSVTESNDPNGRLNKQGGYTASIYFSDSQVTEAVDGASIIDKGTDTGGNVEVYKTADEAENRNTYLSAFDGQGFLNPGSHYVYGSLVIRTSSHLTASQQTALTEAIYHKLIEVRD